MHEKPATLSDALARFVLGTDAGAASAPRDTEQHRTLLQSRLAQLARLNLGFSLLFLGFDLLLWLATQVAGAFELALAHVAALALNAVLWLQMRGEPRSSERLLGTDLLGTLGNCAVFIVVLWFFPSWTRPELVQMLCVNMLLGMRAFLVPSSAARTLWLGSLPVLAIVACTQARYATAPLHPDAPGATTLAVVTGLFGLSVLLVTSLTSRTIYGLRERVLEAFQLGQYTLIEKIGEGGMGIVYRANHAMLRRPTAIKLLPPERAGAHNLMRFEREVQLTSALTHPNTVAVYDYGRSADGLLYYAMEFLDGLDLESLVSLAGAQPPARVIHILTQVCGALAEAHAVGLIHRDIKPGNILLCARGGVYDVAKVVDFGLVKELASAESTSASAVDQIVGTPLFMSPEAILRPQELTAASDIYALGAVAYFLLTGVPPFLGATVVEVCGHHLHSAPKSMAERLGRPLPEALERVVARCLAKQPSERPKSADELAQALFACSEREPWSAEQARAWWSEHPDLLAEHKRRSSAPHERASTVSVGTVAIDLRARSARSGPWQSSGSQPERKRDRVS